MTKISAKTMPGTGAGEFEQAPDDEAQPGCGRGVFSREEVQTKCQGRADQRADIGDQQRLAEHLQPFAPAPEPLADIGPDALAVVEREDAVEIADEIAEIGEQRAQIHFRTDRGEKQRGGEDRDPQQQAEPPAPDRLAISGVEHGKLLLGEDRNRCCHRPEPSSVKERAGSKDPAPVTSP
ncbi:hypothetical protein ABH970_005012 [Bradyrhizobium ottawaense]